MSPKVETIVCPVCSTEVALAVLFADEATRSAFARLAEVSMPLGARVMNYITLFTPPKQRLTVGRQVRLMLQLLPDLERKAISHKGRDWPAPLTAWAIAIDQMLDARAAGRLELPMTGHGYLYAILAGLADKHEARAEAQQERERATRAPGPGTVSEAAHALDVAAAASDAMAAALRGRDPALAKIDADEQLAAPMPAHVRALRAALRGKAPGGQP